MPRIKRVFNSIQLRKLQQGSVLFLINKDFVMNSGFNVVSPIDASLFTNLELMASHVLFYLGYIGRDTYIGGTNHTSLYRIGVVPIDVFFTFQGDFVWTLNEKELNALYAWETN